MTKRFKHFRKLSTEVRLMIWKFGKPSGRIVDIRQIQRRVIREEWNLAQQEAYWRDNDPEKCGYEEDEHGDLVKYSKLWGFRSDAPIPGILLACRESHEVAMKWYPRVFKCSGDNEGPGSVSIPQTYFNHQEDTLLVSQETFAPKYLDETDATISYNLDERGIDPEPVLSGISDLAAEPDFTSIENLAMVVTPDDKYVPWGALSGWLWKILARTFRNLKTFTIVVDYCVSSPHWRDLKMTAEEKADLVFMDELTDVQNTFSFYQQSRPLSRQEKEYGGLVPKYCTYLYTSIPFRSVVRGLAKINKERLDIGGHESFNLPEIEYKIVVPAKLKAALERSKHLYYAKRSINQAD
ncbi:hypothetical protein SBOR_4476 [Sclerotinia borealis F-4128]|uniref:2EXR domain-containing protein n=1 Tax=Sclerotinia borealis (strain F-4128) TaxID=1432307 RepID=W9CKE8_SCLBF|nr:hypothetical protein SBOR_4476 [Sclerotinia borealis F-4128]